MRPPDAETMRGFAYPDPARRRYISRPMPALSRLPLTPRGSPIAMLVSGLIALVTRLATARPDVEALAQGGGTRLADFVRSPLARWSLLVLLALGGAYAASVGWQVGLSVAARVERELQQRARHDTVLPRRCRCRCTAMISHYP